MMKKIYTKLPLLISGVAYCLICFILCLFVAFVVDEATPDRGGIITIFIILGGAVIGCGVICMPHWYSYMQIDGSRNKFMCAFSKATYQPISNYTHIYNATYQHGSVFGAGITLHFIVLSKHPLSVHELSHINQRKSCEDCIKIKYNEKSVSLLMTSLSTKQKKMFAVAFSQDHV